MNSITLKPLEEKYYNDILEMNELLVHFLAPMDLEKLKHLHSISKKFLVAVKNDKAVACAITITGGADYDSVNYRWFEENCQDFLYIDRIIIMPEYHRIGLGTLIYNEVFKIAKDEGLSSVTAEIDILPANPVSLAFHKAKGFKEVSTQYIKGGEKEVSLQIAKI